MIGKIIALLLAVDLVIVLMYWLVPRPLMFPVIIITLDVGASLMYLKAKDFNRAVYWAAAAVLTTSVTFPVRK